MPLNNVFIRPNRSDITVALEKPYFTLWLLMMSIQSLLDPDTVLLNDPRHPLTLAQLQARPDMGKTINYLDLTQVSQALGGSSIMNETQISNVLNNCLASFSSVYQTAVTDFGALALGSNSGIFLYPVDHGCTGTQSVLDVLEAPVSHAGALPEVSRQK